MVSIGIIDNDVQQRMNIKKMLHTGVTAENRPLLQVVFDVGAQLTTLGKRLPTPDIVLVDIECHDESLIELTKNRFQDAEILVLTNAFDIRQVRSCFRHGAIGYILKKTCMSSLLDAIYITINEGSFISPSINRALIEQSFHSKRCENRLTARELQIANGIIEGLSYKMIAQKYTISLDTVRIYIKRIYRKMKINSKGELIAQLTA